MFANWLEACWPSQAGCLTSIDETTVSLCSGRRRAVDQPLDAEMEAIFADSRRGHTVRLRLYARGPKAARSAAATHRCSPPSARAITRENIRPNILDREKHGWADWLSRCAGRANRWPDLPRLSTLCDGRPNKIAG